MTGILIAVFVIALIIGIPVSVAMGGAGIAALLWGGTFSPMLVPQRLFSGIDSFPLMAVPFFILAAELMTGGRITDLLVRFACQLIGNVRGGLGYANVIMAIFMAGISGSALADAAGPGSVIIRMMRQAGYPVSYAAALTASSAIIAPIIPPSIIMIIYALTDSSVSVIGLFLAGIVPGLLLGLSLLVVNWWISRRVKLRLPDPTARLETVPPGFMESFPCAVDARDHIGRHTRWCFHPHGSLCRRRRLCLPRRSLCDWHFVASAGSAHPCIDSNHDFGGSTRRIDGQYLCVHADRAADPSGREPANRRTGLVTNHAPHRRFAVPFGVRTFPRHIARGDHSRADPCSARAKRRNRSPAFCHGRHSQSDDRHDHPTRRSRSLRRDRRCQGPNLLPGTRHPSHACGRTHCFRTDRVLSGTDALAAQSVRLRPYKFRSQTGGKERCSRNCSF